MGFAMHAELKIRTTGFSASGVAVLRRHPILLLDSLLLTGLIE